MTAFPQLIFTSTDSEKNNQISDQDTIAQTMEDMYDLRFWNSQFRQYSFQKLAAETENSLIWMGKRIADGKKVALKITQKFQNPTSQKIHQSHQNYFVQHNRLRHMVQILEISYSTEYRLMAMQYYCWDLDYILKQFTTHTNRRYTKHHENFVIYAFKAIISAVQELHSLGYIHRDLKPDNILVDEEFNIVLGDFGLVTKELDVDTSISGTLEYLAPERLSKLRRQDPINKSTDVWSLGIILYELFTGETPYNGDIQQEIYEEICEGYIRYKQIPSQAINLITGILQVNNQKRLSLQQIKNHPFLQREIDLNSIKQFILTSY